MQCVSIADKHERMENGLRSEVGKVECEEHTNKAKQASAFEELQQKLGTTKAATEEEVRERVEKILEREAKDGAQEEISSDESEFGVGAQRRKARPAAKRALRRTASNATSVNTDLLTPVKNPQAFGQGPVHDSPRSTIFSQSPGVGASEGNEGPADYSFEDIIVNWFSGQGLRSA